jgi:hypothetical protein
MHHIAIAEAEYQDRYRVPTTVVQLHSPTSSIRIHLYNKLSIFN